MECKKALELLSGYIDGVLKDDEKSELEKHLNTCKSCSQEYEFLKTILNKCHDLDDYDLPFSFKDDLHNRLQSDKKDTKNKIVQFSHVYRKVAAGFIILVLSVGLIKGITFLGTEMQEKTSSMPQNMVASQAQKNDFSGAKAEDQSKDTSTESIGQGDSERIDKSSESKAMLYSAPANADSLFMSNICGMIAINLTKDEYEKNKNDIADIIKTVGGNIKSSDQIEYTIPYIKADEFIKKVRDDLKITDLKIEPEKKAASDKESEISGYYKIILNIKD